MEITKLVKPGRDNYEYIRSSHLGGDIFPIGAGAGGFVNNTAFMNPLEKEKFEKHAGGLDKTIGMAIKPAYKRVKRFSGQLQEGTVETELLTEKELDKAKNIISLLESENLIRKKSDGKNYAFTDKGFFWGNSLSADFAKKIF